MKRLLLLLALLTAVPGAAQTGGDASPRVWPAIWGVQAIEEGRYLRGAAEDGEGGRRKLLFLCNNARQLIVMGLWGDAEPQAIVDRIGSVAILVDAAPEPAISREAAAPFAANGNVFSIARIEDGLFRRMLEARAIGFAWIDGGGGRIAGFQLDMTGGRAPLAAFARDCNSERYP